MFVDVASLKELEEGRPTPFTVSGRQIVIVRWRREVFAVRNICPHQSMRFDNGRVHESVFAGAAPGRPALVGDTPLLQCPVHAWDYELRTGRCSVDPTKRVRTYATRVDGDRVLVDTSAKGDSEP